MITKEQVIEKVEEKMNDDLFLVDVNISPGNEITVVIDGDRGVTVRQCVEVSRHVENAFDRDEEDFQLSVLSFGLGEPFKMVRQYKKYVGRDIEVVTTDGKELKALLTVVDDNGIRIEHSHRERVEGKKKKQLVTDTYEFSYAQIKLAKSVISFK